MARRAGKSHRKSLQEEKVVPLSEQRSLGWMDAIAIPLLLLDPQGKILGSNQALQSLTGCRAADLQQVYLWEFAPKTEQAHLQTTLAVLVDHQAAPTLTFVWQTRTGDPLPLTWTFKPLPNIDENHLIWVATGQPSSSLTSLPADIQHMEQKRLESEVSFHSLMVGTAAVTGQEFFPTFVEQVATALGVSHALVTELQDDQLKTLAFWSQGKLQPNFIYPYLRTPCELSLQQGVYACPVAVQESFPQDQDLVQLKAESYLGVAIKNRHGDPIGNLCLVDTKPLANVERMETILRIFASRAAAELERQRATDALESLNHSVEQALQESQTLLKLVLDTLPLAIFWKDRNCRFLGCNQQMLSDAGLAAVSEIIGKTDFDLPWRQEAPRYRADDLAVMETGQPRLNIQEPITKAGNDYRWLLTNKMPLRNAEGDIIGVLGIYEDITDRKHMETQLLQSNENLALANQELSRATRLKDEFLANISHELRTPLSSILGMTQALSREVYGPMTERQHRSLNIVERSGRHLLQLINNLLETAKIESGKVELQVREVSISKLCEDSLVYVQQQALQKHIVLNSRIQEDAKNLTGDELRLKQALVNLLDNAIKFTPEGGRVDLQVALSSRPPESLRSQGQVISISVLDTGIGIAPTDRARLFQTFVQIDSSLNRQYFGTGLGLAMVKHIAELHGGIIEVESQPDQGSCFTLYLPLT